MDEGPSDNPDQGKEHNAEQEPRERETEHARRHQFGQKIIYQWQAEQRDEESSGTSNGQPELAAHQRVKKSLAVDVRLFGRSGVHALGVANA